MKSTEVCSFNPENFGGKPKAREYFSKDNPYLHLLPDALAAEVLGFVQVVCREAACQKLHQSVSQCIVEKSVIYKIFHDFSKNFLNITFGIWVFYNMHKNISVILNQNESQ